MMMKKVVEEVVEGEVGDKVQGESGEDWVELLVS